MGPKLRYPTVHTYSKYIHEYIHTHAYIHIHTYTWSYKQPGRFEKAWLATRVSLRLACMPHPARARRSRRLRATLAAAPVLFAHTIGPFHMEKTYSISGIGVVDVRRQSVCMRSKDWLATPVLFAHAVVRCEMEKNEPDWRPQAHRAIPPVPNFWTYGSVCCACAQRPGLPRACHSG